ncbi:SDR family oxidoreductase [Phyllobacterium sp. 21LDTY02-6]|uniref:SDR family NAD(P)-dependent oxidoreductase n=1 Tax=Phyllobacterium sp. 21LDTY02-6 TaxID=2944903 RepID=UPI0020225331|nr:SDR family NAD(P)-dependent oxidoreductase [Phyllobacterium sp. 21LDTY02-6]MCO4317565.1 SDR family oxidoreductase [Phyllobacterium sp. 21LDTY02-6]
MLEGKIAIITGGAQGIGAAIAKRYLHDGARVMIGDTNQQRGEATLRELAAIGDARFMAADVSSRLDVHNLVAATVEAFGDVDILVNNAGVVHAADFLDLAEEDFDRVLRINLKGPFLCSQAVARHMVERVRNGGVPGSIINMSSINAVVAIPDQVPYSVSKGGIAQLTRVLALSLAEYGIRVNAIGPGSIRTDMLEDVLSDPAAKERMLSRTPLGRAGDPAEIAAIAAFLASDDASYITGQTIFADGGRLPLNYMVPVNT